MSNSLLTIPLLLLFSLTGYTVIKRLKCRVLCVTPLLIAVLMTGCAKTPFPTRYTLTKQKQMQAAHHWQILAKDIAQQVKLGLIGKKLNNQTPIFIRSNYETPFGHIFHSLITSELLEMNIPVSKGESGAIIMEVEARVLGHSGRQFHQSPYKWTALAAGVNVLRAVIDTSYETLLLMAIPVGVAADSGFIGTADNSPSNEVIISTSLVHNENIVFNNVDIYYINDPDWWHYDKNPYKKHSGAGTKTYKTVTE